MSIIKRHIAKIQKAESRLEKIAQNAVRDNVDIIIGLLVEGQLHKGIKSDGSDAPPYSSATENLWAKDPSNLPRLPKETGEPWNFDWSGTWIESFFVKSENDGYSIFSRDGKTAMLERMAGGKLMALTEEHNQIINEQIIKPELYKFMLTNIVSF